MSISKQDLIRIAKKYLPKGIKVRWRKDNKLKPAHADLRKAEILSPKLVSVDSLAFFVHECGHFHLKHFTKEEARGDPLLELLYTGRAKKTYAEQEYECEQYVIMVFRKEKIVLSRELLGEMKCYVADCIAEGDTLFNKSPKHVRKWID